MKRVPRHFPSRRWLVPLLLAVVCAVVPAAAADDLSARRSVQREKVRAASLRAAQTGRGAPFGLLVIPVDFADARLAAGYEPGRDLAPRLTGTGGQQSTGHHPRITR